MSDVRVSVQWKSSVVFAGEDLECIITFNNVSQAYHVGNSSSSSSNLRNQSTARERWKESLPHHDPSKSIGHTRNNSISKSDHARETSRTRWPPSSLTTPAVIRHGTGIAEAQSTKGNTKQERHRRSVSIVSLAHDAHQTPNTQTETPTPTFPRPVRGHARAASLQVLPWRNGMVQEGPISGKIYCSRSGCRTNPSLFSSGKWSHIYTTLNTTKSIDVREQSKSESQHSHLQITKSRARRRSQFAKGFSGSI